jgi:predicted DNA binding protein
MNKYITVSFCQDPLTKSKVKSKLQFVSKTKAHEDFAVVKSDCLCQIKDFYNRNDIYESDFKLVHLSFGINSPVEYDVNIQTDTTWKEMHDNVISTMKDQASDWYTSGGLEIENIKLGFDLFNCFSYWNNPWNTLDDNDCVFVTHTKRRNGWKKLMVSV